jgi:hypothetical protein
LLNSGKFFLTIRSNDTNGYTVSVSINGLIELYGNSVLITSASVSPLSNGQWRTLYASAIGDTVRVRFDGVEVINFVDSTPLPLGEVVIRGQEVDQTGLYIDNFSIWSDYSPSHPSSVGVQLNPNNLPLSANVQPLISGTDMVVYQHDDSPSLGTFGREIYSINANGGSVYNWTASYNYNPRLPSLSPNGQWIAFVAIEPYPPNPAISVSMLKVINVMTGVIYTLYNFPDQFTGAGTVTWKPDGTQLAFVSTLDGSYDIWVTKFSPGDISTPPSVSPLINVTNTNTSIINGSPDWGTNGLIYPESRIDGQKSIKIIFNGITFNVPTFAISTFFPNGRSLAWSPDGTKVVYALEEKLHPNDYRALSNLSYFDINDGIPHRITTDQATDPNLK